MEAVREILDSAILEPIISLPKSLKNRKVEVVVFPYQETQVNNEIRHSAFGSLQGYARQDLKEAENNAFALAMASKHADS